MTTPVVLIRGDGIGPEVTQAAQAIVQAAGAHVDWVEAESFSLQMQQGSSFRLGPKTNIERTYYVKLGIDFPDNRFDRSPLWVRGHRRHRCVDRASIIRGLSRAVYSLAHLWASKGCLKSGPVNRTPNQRLQTQVNLPLEASKGGLS